MRCNTLQLCRLREAGVPVAGPFLIQRSTAMSRPALMLVTCGVLCAITACAGSPSRGGGQSSDFAQNATFTMAVKQDFGSFDPYTNPNILGYTPLTYDSLVNLQPDGKFVSGLAEKWTADAKTATFTLRSGVT